MPRGRSRKSTIKTDEQNFHNYENGSTTLNFSSLANLIMRDYAYQDFSVHNKFMEITKKDLLEYLYNPCVYKDILIKLSRYMFNFSGYYRRLIYHMAHMSTLNWVVSVNNLTDNNGDAINYSSINQKSFLSKYNNIVYMMDKMSVEHELDKIFNIVFKDGVYFGYEVSGKDSIFFRQLNPIHCRINGLQDGCYIFEINLSAISAIETKSLPEDIQKLYQDWINNDKKDSSWVQLDSKKALCLKTDEDSLSICPMFVYLLADIMDLDDFKDLQKTASEIDNFRLLTLLVPVDTSLNQVDRVQLSADMVKEFTQIANEVVPEHTGVLPTPMKPEFVSAKSSTVEKDNVKSAIATMYKSSGSQLLNNESNIGLAYSLEADAAIVYGLLKQFARFINRKIKLSKMNPHYCTFKVSFLEQTIYNRQKVTDQLRGVAERSIPCLPELAASVGITPNKIEGNHFISNIIFDFPHKWFSPKTSYTQGAIDGGGIGGKIDNIEELSDEGMATRESDANNPDART